MDTDKYAETSIITDSLKSIQFSSTDTYKALVRETSPPAFETWPYHMIYMCRYPL